MKRRTLFFLERNSHECEKQFEEGRKSDEKNTAGRMGEHDARRTRSLESTKRTKNAGHSLLRAVSNLFCTAEAFNVKAAP